MDVRSTYDLKSLKVTCARSRRIGSYELSCVNMRLVHDCKRVLYEDATKYTPTAVVIDNNLPI